MKQPYSKVPRFIELPKVGNNYYLMFIEDIIKANLDVIFPGYDVESSYCIKISSRCGYTDRRCRQHFRNHRTGKD